MNKLCARIMFIKYHEFILYSHLNNRSASAFDWTTPKWIQDSYHLDANYKMPTDEVLDTWYIKPEQMVFDSHTTMIMTQV